MRSLDHVRLRWLTVWAPTAFFALLISIAFHLHAGPLPGSVVFLLVVTLAGGGAYLFSRFVFASIQRQEEDVVRRNRELAVLNAVGAVLDGSLVLDEVLPRALDTILAGIGVEAGEIFLRDEETGEMVLRAHRGLFPEAFQEMIRFKFGEGFPGRVAASGEAIVVHDLARDPRFLRAQVVRSGFQAFASIPLKARDEVLGVLNVAALDPRRPAPEEVRLLTALGHQLGIAVENFRLSGRLQVMAVLGERQRLAREMHDSLAQRLSYVHLKLADVAELVRRDVAQAEADLSELKHVTREAYEEVRQAIFGLRTMVSRHLGLVPTLTEYLHEWNRRTGIAVDLRTGGAEALRLAPVVEVQLIRIVQEALANVRRHAAARRVIVVLEPAGALARVAVRDDGRGFDPTAVLGERRQCFGLDTMRERAEGVGGKFVLTASPGQGTTVEVWLPLIEPARKEAGP